MQAARRRASQRTWQAGVLQTAVLQFLLGALLLALAGQAAGDVRRQARQAGRLAAEAMHLKATRLLGAKEGPQGAQEGPHPHMGLR
jgi:hypothetical protein